MEHLLTLNIVEAISQSMNAEHVYILMKKNKPNMHLYQEQLQSRLEIQDRSLHTYAKEIYENVAQVLSLARLQLLSLQADQDNAIEKAKDSGKLVGKAIADLRNLTKQVSPEEIIKKGFADAIHTELIRLQQAGICSLDFSVKGNFFSLDEAKELVTFCIVQQLLYPLTSTGNPFSIKVIIDYGKQKVSITLHIQTEVDHYLINKEELTVLKKRIQLIEGSIRYVNQNNSPIQLTIKI